MRGAQLLVYYPLLGANPIHSIQMSRRSRRQYIPLRRSSSLCTERGSIPRLISISRSDSTTSNSAAVGSSLVDLFPQRTQSPIEYPADQCYPYPAPQARPARLQINTSKREDSSGFNIVPTRPDSCPPDLNVFGASLRAMGVDSYYIRSPNVVSSDSSSSSDSDSDPDHPPSAESAFISSPAWQARRYAMVVDPDQLDAEFQQLVASQETEELWVNGSQSTYQGFGNPEVKGAHGPAHSHHKRDIKSDLENVRPAHEKMFTNKHLPPGRQKDNGLGIQPHQVRTRILEESSYGLEAPPHLVSTPLGHVNPLRPIIGYPQHPGSAYGHYPSLPSIPLGSTTSRRPGIKTPGKPSLKAKKQVRIDPVVDFASTPLLYEETRQPSSPSGSSSVSEFIAWPQTPPNDARLVQTSGALEGTILSSSQSPHHDSRKISRQMSISEIISHLVKHGCQNLTDQLNLTTFDQYPIATGGFSDVYRGYLHDGQQVGVKALRVDAQSLSQNPKHLKRAARELHTWSKCRHPNVLQLFGLGVFRGRIGMVSPWMGNGNLRQYLRREPEVNKCILCAQIADGLTYMHGIGIAHGDIKGANVLVSSDGIPALTDFGNSDLQERTLGFTQSTTGGAMTLRWSAPEVIDGACKCDKAADIYALGMTILEVFTGEQPYHYIKSESTVMVRVLTKKQIPHRPNTIPIKSRDGDKLWNLLVACWSYKPKARPIGPVISDTLWGIASQGLVSR